MTKAKHINLLIFCRPNFAKHTTDGAFLCENILLNASMTLLTIYDNALIS